MKSIITMANPLPPNLPVPPMSPAGAVPGTGFDVPDPFEEVSSMPDKTSQPNPLITPPEIDEKLEKVQGDSCCLLLEL
jgi:hypothetical protein